MRLIRNIYLKIINTLDDGLRSLSHANYIDNFKNFGIYTLTWPIMLISEDWPNCGPMIEYHFIVQVITEYTVSFPFLYNKKHLDQT